MRTHFFLNYKCTKFKIPGISQPVFFTMTQHYATSYMDITVSSKRLREDQHFTKHCPPSFIRILEAASGSAYIELISELALDPLHTSTIFAIHSDIAVDICGRWLSCQTSKDRSLEVMSAISQVLPFSRSLLAYATFILKRNPDLFKNHFRLDIVLEHSDINQEALRIVLLTLIRLLRFDSEEFSSFIPLAYIQLLFDNPDPCIRFLSVKLFSIYFSLSENHSTNLFDHYVGQEKAEYFIESKLLNLRFLDLWEKERLFEAEHLLKHDVNRHEPQISPKKILSSSDHAPTTVDCGGVLLSNFDVARIDSVGFVESETTMENLRSLARAVKDSDAIIVSGPPGSGKTTLMDQLSRLLGKHRDMVTLHLNEQSDFKTLVGLYTNDQSSTTFQWQPGCLTRAVQRGHWILVEDLDRAPRDIVASLLSLVERRELHIVSQGCTIRAAQDFKILATVRSIQAYRAYPSGPLKTIMGVQNWMTVYFAILREHDVRAIVQQRFPSLTTYMPRIMQLYRNVSSFSFESTYPAQGIISLGSQYLRELLRWCSRISVLFNKPVSTSGNGFVSENVNETCFLEAMDVFGSLLPDLDEGKEKIAGLIARALDFPHARVEYCLMQRRPRLSIEGLHLRIGRSTLPRQKQLSGTINEQPASGTFAFTDPALRMLESMSAAVAASEACLLVGETGVGKTRVIQQLADMTNNKLNAVNLSQQTDASDLLGGYKPTNIRTLVISLKEDFEDLFRLTFPTGRNERFLGSITKAVAKQRYSRALSLWQEALSLVEKKLDVQRQSEPLDQTHHPSKRRKLGSTSLQNIKSRWSGVKLKVQTLRKQLEAGVKGFAFTFVPGRLINAARNGEWVLLDEINLASPDTLESIADLLDNKDGVRSILLTEKGSFEHITAHKNFRLFAAMNPATDVGKRGLPYAVRSRFTEMNIEGPDKDISTLTRLVKTSLGNKAESEPEIVVEVSKLYMEIKKLQDAHALTDGSGQAPHFSLRNLTRVLQFVSDTYRFYGLRRALYEGFYMGFLTTLSKTSEQLVENLLGQYILTPEKISRKNLIQKPHLPEHEINHVWFKHYQLPLGPLPPVKKSHYVITPFVDSHLSKLVRATTGRQSPILLQGPTSSGKTSMIEYLADLSGNKFIRVNNHEHTDIQEYIGTYSVNARGDFEYRDGVLVKALREGYWIVLDELNLAPSDVLEALNRLLDDNRELLIPETQEIVRPHPNFMLFATQNPSGLYGGRKPLSRAFRNRFLEIHFDEIPTADLEIILRERSQIAPSFCTRIVAVYERLTKLRKEDPNFEGRGSLVTLRDLFRWASRDVDTKDKLAQQGFMLLAERVRNRDGRQAVKKVIQEVMKININEEDLYDLKPPSEAVVGLSQRAPDVVWTASARRLYCLLDEALKNNEPVLLIGDTGVGKTRMCQVLAQIHEKELIIVNAHQNLETGDLIGSQRPLRDNVRIDNELYSELIELMNLTGNPADYDLSELIVRFENLRSTNALNPIEHAVTSIAGKIGQHWARFEWSDGPLIRSMRTGQLFLLDEISLADDAVLERLNSVLEPSRSIYLAEKGSDVAPIVASEAFQFLATMNPGGDYGKRELSPALRNRFTEIWVPPSTERTEYEEIVRATLQHHKAHLAKPMVDFSLWYANEFSPHRQSVSLRDMLAWVEFVNNIPQDGYRPAIIQGASMVYIDALGADPAAKMVLSEASLDEARHSCLQKLHDLFEGGTASLYNQTPTVRLSPGELSVGDFRISHDPSTTNLNSRGFCFDAPTTKANTFKIARAMSIPKSILLEGSPGVGKTTLVEAIAAAIGIPLTRLNLSEQTDISDLFGSDVPLEGEGPGRFGWCDAPFLRAMRSGHWVLLDEMNLASQAVLEGLNACLDHRGQVYIAELNQTFDRHPKFRVFAAQNPRQQGGGRKGLPDSFVNRFTTVFIDRFTRQDLRTICKYAFEQVSASTLERIITTVTKADSLVKASVAMSNQAGPNEFNLRDAFRWLKLLTSTQGLASISSVADFEDMLFRQRMRTSGDAARISSAFVEESDHAVGRLSRTVAPTFVQYGLAFLSRRDSVPLGVHQGVVSSKFDGNIRESSLLCIQQDWPCLLVGSSGSGKTTLISQLATEVGAKVVTVSLNADTDTADLIGGYEQVDHMRFASRFLNNLRVIIRDLILETHKGQTASKRRLIDVWDQIKSSSPSLTHLVHLLEECSDLFVSKDLKPLLEQAKALLQASTVKTEPYFEWVDSELIEAMHRGDWVVLDNANLCNSSILDRLNSLLEPRSYLSINEHCLPDGSARIVNPHVDFRLFMTMDPIHGELSRAMRNRSVELFMPVKPHQRGILDRKFTLGSQLASFDVFNLFRWNDLNDTDFSELLTVFLDHLPFASVEISLEWREEVARGLSCLDPLKMALFMSEYAKFQEFCADENGLLEDIRNAYVDIANNIFPNATEPGTFSAWQPIHPYNNSALVRTAPPRNAAHSLRSFGRLLDVTIKTHKINAEFRANDSSSTQIRSRDRLHGIRETMSRQKEWIQSYIVMIRDVENRLDESSLLHHLDIVERLISWFWVLFENTIRRPLRNDVVRAVLTVGHDVVNNAITEANNTSAGRSFLERYIQVQQEWKLTRGLSMEILWKTLRSPAPTSASQNRMLKMFENVTKRFESVKWKAGVSLSQIASLHHSLTKISLTSGQGLPDQENIEAETIMLERIQQILSMIETRCDPQTEMIEPYFAKVFELLRQRYVMTNNNSAADTGGMPAMVQLLSLKPTIRSEERTYPSLPLRAFEEFSSAAGTDQATDTLSTIRAILPLEILSMLEGVSAVPLTALGLLEEEFSVLCVSTAQISNTLSENGLISMLIKLTSLLEILIDCHDHLLEQQSYQACKEQLARVINVLEKRSQSTSIGPPPQLKAIVGSNKGSYLQPIINRYLQPALQSMWKGVAAIAQNIQDQSIKYTGAAILNFFAGCLSLYVPDQHFDPAIRSQVEHERHATEMEGLTRRIKSLIHYEQVSVGQTSSFRIAYEQSRLQVLQSQTLPPLVWRPDTSALSHLQRDFDSIDRNIISRLQCANKNAGPVEYNQIGKETAQLLRQNISSSISRIGSFSDRLAYSDILRPLVAMLRGLDAGLSMVTITDSESSNCAAEIRAVCQFTPLMHLRPETLQILKCGHVRNSASTSIDLQTSLLQLIVLKVIIETRIDTQDSDLIMKAFQNLYSIWKNQLNQEQAESAKRSATYRYRGGQQEAESSEEQEFEELFCVYPENLMSSTPKPLRKVNQQVLSQKVAQLHRNIFSLDQDPVAMISSMLEQASAKVVEISRFLPAMSVSPVPTDALLAAVIARLGDHFEDATARTTQDSKASFYHDPDVFELKRLVDIIGLVRARFLVLEDVWPEHETIKEVLRCTNEMLYVSHSAPLASMIGRVEQMHAAVHQWQSVASSQFSVQSLCDDLTALLISWRRLELLTWSRLLDEEDKASAQRVDSWWFVAYEAIVVAPMSLLENEGDLQGHAESLFGTLEEFMSTCAKGQFDGRLRLLNDFCRLLESRESSFPQITIFSNTVANCVKYYGNFISLVQGDLQKKRESLEKDLKEILLLASWKDTNVDALRESAKRSHHKLFKVVKKYRDILAESSQVILSQDFPCLYPGHKKVSLGHSSVSSALQDESALLLCSLRLPDWASRPGRFLDAKMTAKKMQTMCALPQEAINPAEVLRVFTENLTNDIKALQNATPPTWTKENEDQIKYLKARKRKLFAETLKSIRQMGFRSNLNSKAQEGQETISKVLSRTPTDLTGERKAQPLPSDLHFYKILNLLPKLKVRARNHTEDLNSGEVSRVMGLLESALHTIIQERVIMSSSTSDHVRLEVLIQKMHVLWVPDAYQLEALANRSPESIDDSKNLVAWLQPIIRTAIKIISKHGKMADMDHGFVVQRMEDWLLRLAEHAQDLVRLPNLPAQVTSSSHRAVHETLKSSILKLRQEVKILTERHPHLGFIMKQIEIWTALKSNNTDRSCTGDYFVLSVQDLDKHMSQVLDSILVAMQKAKTAITNFPSNEEEQNWLFLAETSIVDTLKALRGSQICALLDRVLINLGHLDSSNDENIRLAGAMLATTLPIIRQYQAIQSAFLLRFKSAHEEMCKLGAVLAENALHLFSHGFCSPEKASKGDVEQGQKMEGGIGLGEGEGAEDISKDIEDDEDLTELAQNSARGKDKTGTEEQKDAVNMDCEELESEIGGVTANEDDETPQDGDGSEQDDLNEELGDVDELDPTAVDEKTWDGEEKQKKDGRDKESSKEAATLRKDDRHVGERADEQTREDQQGSEVADNASDAGLGEDDIVKQHDPTQLDPRVEKDINLDLPPEIDFDQDGRSSTTSGMTGVDGLESLDESEQLGAGTDDEGQEDAGTADQSDNVDDVQHDKLQEAAGKEKLEELGEAGSKTDEAISVVDTDPDNDLDVEMQEVSDHTRDVELDHGMIAPSEVLGFGGDLEQHEDNDTRSTDPNASKSKSIAGADSEEQKARRNSQSDQAVDVQESDGRSSGGDQSRRPSKMQEAFKSLGNALDEWHRRKSGIQPASDNSREPGPKPGKNELAEAAFEHLPDESTEADTQALGNAMNEQAQPHDKQAMASGAKDMAEGAFPNEEDSELDDTESAKMYGFESQSASAEENESNLEALNGNVAQISLREQRQTHPEAMDMDLSPARPQTPTSDHYALELTPPISPSAIDNPQAHYIHDMHLTNPLAFQLTEQLRLILNPTHATKYRGGYKTGSRLNMKAVMRFYASNFREDKIFMRRSIPQKRGYQIMLCIDDSRSMRDNAPQPSSDTNPLPRDEDAGALALQSLALVTKSLTMLESGEICVVGFGETINVHCAFSDTWSDSLGAQIWSQFRFQQRKTNVLKLLERSLSLFRDARRESRAASSGDQLWQLQIIVSDGVCEDHESIRRLVRQALEERIMIMFVIVDAANKNKSKNPNSNPSKERGGEASTSILDMTQAVFEAQGEGQEPKLTIKRYLDDFPFAYYPVVGDVKELPNVLSSVLRQWFSEIAET